jgi:polyisoprenoid-binding protein YceI
MFKSGDYTANSDSSSILWECGWLGGRSHNGDVAIKEGSVNIKNGRIVSAGFVVNMNTIQCFDLKNGGKRNNLISHLKSDDFFDVENHQEARLMITSSKDLGGNNFLFSGSLTIKDITNPIQMEGRVQTTTEGYAADIKLVFDRSRYNVRYKSASFFSDLGDNIISDSVSLNAKIRLRKIS